MNRRHLLAALFSTRVRASAQTGAAERPEESLYIPKPQRVEDRRFLQDFMDEFSFIDLVTASPSLRITHIPVWIDRSAGEYGTIYGHVSRQNPQSETIDGTRTGVAVFRGPHGYISPAWYSTNRNAVPTWNFAVVHATGKLRPVTGRKELTELLSRLIAKFESYEGTSYDFRKVDESVKASLMAGITGFALEIQLLEGKFKLGQERSPADRQTLLDGLRAAKSPRSLGEFAADFYKRQ